MSLQAEMPRLGTPFRVLKLVGAAVLVVGAGSGLFFNRTAAGARVRVSDDPSVRIAPEPLPEAEPVVAASDGDRRILFSLKSVKTDVPPDPFRPVPLRRAITRTPVLGQGDAQLWVTPNSSSSFQEAAAPAPAAARATAPAAEHKAAAAPAPSLKDIALTGVVQGDPALAVVQFEGQSLFLKIGDQVADSWRLVEVRERSAIFQMGARRVEVPIKGGSSE